MDDYEKYLFRGKRTDNGEWVEGYYASQSNYSCTNRKTIHFILRDECRDIGMGGLEYYEVDPETVGQYTGSTDKNGKKIFEGDVVRAITHLTEIYVEAVTFKNGAFWYKNWSWVKFGFKFEKAEVIGNIYDNPELLNEVYE